jgi:hypothetical protein
MAESVKMVGTSGQLSLGKKYAGQYYEVTSLPDGAIVLRPMKVVPAGEAWVHEPKMQYQLKRAAEWFRKNPPTETDLAALEALLSKRRKQK